MHAQRVKPVAICSHYSTKKPNPLNSQKQEHLQHFGMVFKYLKEANLKIKLSKCQFFKRYLHYLGHLISELGIQPLNKSINTV